MKTFNYSTISKNRILIQRTTLRWSFVFILASFLFPLLSESQTVTTEKVDNPFDEMVYSSGAGWIPGETIEIVVTGDPVKADNFSFTRKIIADRKGFFRSELFRPGISHGSYFHVSATGLSSEHTSTITFNVSDQNSLYQNVRHTESDLYQAPEFRFYPNPFVSEITFEISMTYDSHVKLEICNNAGTLLETICDEDLKQGDFRKFEFDATRYPHSLFIYRLTTRNKKLSGIIMKLL